MDVTVAGCHEMNDAAQQAGKLLQVDFHKRFDPYHIETYEMARQGQLGPSSMAMPGWKTASRCRATGSPAGCIALVPRLVPRRAHV